MNVFEANRAYEEHRDYVLAVLRRRCGWLATDEREALFHDAYAVLLEKERDGELDPSTMHGNQVRAYLTQTALFKALDEGKRAERNRSAPLEDAGAFEEDASRPLEDSVSAELEGARVREIVAELPRRRQAIVKLRFFFERTPDEIQDLLGVSSRVYRRELERAVKQIADRYELVREGTFCDSKRSLLLAFVAGLAGPGRAREARAHLETCPACASWTMEMRATTRRAAAFLPLPALTGLGSRSARFGDALGWARDHLSSLLTGAKQNAAALAGRVDTGAGGYLAGTRPGAVVATVIGCAAIGGGAYCAVDGVPRGLIDALPGVHLEEGAKERAKRPVRQIVHRPTPVVVHHVEPPEPEPKPVVHHHRHHANPEAQAASSHEGSHLEAEAAAAEEEFGLEAEATTSEPEAYASEGSYPAPSTAPPPPEETPGSSAEFSP
ncbi:MAG: sigma-70 family RNA polymerase sigma factor [Actinobacteria bacterium]|nr:sigma-70 family RNA polymerase sigma factor [Actinomycetota bacterium]